MKKAISLFLCIVICIGIIPTTTLAATRNTSFEEELAMPLYELGLFLGGTPNADGSPNFDLGRAPTRLEALVILIRLLGQEAEVKACTAPCPFDDVPDWGREYVAYAYETGLTKGVPGGKFGMSNADAAQCLTFVLRALGYTDADDGSADFTWNNPYALARRIGILPNCVNTKNFWRADIVTVSYAALPVFLKGSNQTLAQKLIAADAFTQKQFDACYDHNAISRYETEKVEGMPTLNNSMVRDNEYYDALTVTHITFLDTLSAAPANAWDFSELQNDSVLAWLEGTHLYIAGEGGVAAGKDASRMFQYENYYGEYGQKQVRGFGALASIDFGNCFDTSNVTDMSQMFDNCKALTELDVSGFDTSNVTDMSQMFFGCKALTELDVSGFDTSKIESMRSLFSGCTALTSLDLRGFDTSNVASMDYMFKDCHALTNLNVNGFDTSKIESMHSLFSGCTALTSLDLRSFDTSKVTNMNRMFSGCNSLAALDVSRFDTSKVTDMSWMFFCCSALTKLDLSGFDTSSVTDMSTMFYGCDSLTTLDISRFDTSNVTDMSDIFYDCKALTELDVSRFRTPKVTNMRAMFSNCESLTQLDTSSFDTSNVKEMMAMFSGCKGLTKLDLSNFDTSQAQWTYSMFADCESLTELNVSSFDTSKVSNMARMFYNCSSLTKLDIRNFDMSNASTKDMFTGVTCQILQG